MKEKMVMGGEGSNGAPPPPPPPPPSLPPLPPKRLRTEAWPLPPSKRGKSCVWMVPIPPPPTPAFHAYYYPALRDREPHPVTLDLITSMEGGVNFSEPETDWWRKPPSNEMLKAWAASLRLGDGIWKPLDLSLKLGMD